MKAIWIQCARSNDCSNYQSEQCQKCWHNDQAEKKVTTNYTDKNKYHTMY